MSINIEEMSREDISRILSNQIDIEDHDVLSDSDSEPEDYVDDDLDDIRLTELSEDEIDCLNVSPRSKFRDDIWQLGDSIATVTNVVNKLNFGEARNHLIKKMLKHWAFYYLPCTTDNRAQTAYYQFRSLLVLVNAIHDIGFFEESNVIAHHQSLDTFTIDDRDKLFAHLKNLGIPVGQLQKVGFLLESLCYGKMLTGALPSEYSFSFDIYKDKNRLEEFPSAELNPWKPISPDSLYPVAQVALEVLDTVAPDIIKLYQPFSLAERRADQEASEYGQSSYKKRYLRTKYISEVIDPMLDEFSFSRLFGAEPWNELEVNEGWQKESYMYDFSKYNKRFIKYKGNKLVRSACEIIISLTLGLRSSELRGLKTGCCRLCEDNKDEYEIDVTIFKTAKDAEGKQVTLPCPPVTHKAVKIMEDLLMHKREDMGVDYLFLLSSSDKTALLSSSLLKHDLQYFADFVGVDYFHHHQFRKTIAHFIIHQDPRNIDLIKRLFSHTSISMSLRYIVHMPTIARDVHSLLVKENVEVFADLLASAAKGTISGRQRDYLIASTKGENALFKGETEGELGRNILSYIETLMRNGTTLLRRAPMNLCIGEASPTQKCHCRKESEPAELQYMPNVANCQPYGCSGSIFTENDEFEIRNEIDFYESLQGHPAASNFVKKDAQIKLSKLHKIFDEITLPLEGATA